MKHHIIRFMIAPALLAILLAGCVKRNLEIYPTELDGRVDIVLDWGNSTPSQSACYLFYDESGQLVKDATGVAGSYKGSLPAGKYSIVVYNEDAINVGYRGLHNYSTAEVFVLAKDARSGRQSSRAATLIDEPRQVFGTGVCKEFEQLVIEPNKTTTATAEPKLLTREVQLFFKVNGSDGVRSLEGVLGGVVSGVFLSTGAYNTASVGSLEFSVSSRIEATEVEFTANIGVFDLLTTTESEPDTNTISITLTEDNGTVHGTTVDLTETLKEIIGDNGGVIPIEIPVEVILEVKAIDGLTATVRPWDNSGSGSGNPRP